MFVLVIFSVSLSCAAEPDSHGNRDGSEKGLFDKSHLVCTSNGIITKAPIIENGKIVLMTESGLETFELETGKKLWDYQIGGKGTYKPLVADETIYLPAEKRAFCAIDLETGKEIWREQVGSRVPGFKPVLYRGKIYLATTRGVYALETKSGKVLWSIDEGPFGMNPILMDSNLIIISKGKSSILRIEHDSGRILGVHKLKYDHFCTAHDINNLYYYGFRFLESMAIEETVVCLNIKEGNIVWQVPFDEKFYVAGFDLNLWRNHLFVFMRLKEEIDPNKAKLVLCKMDAMSGKTLWTVEFDNAATDIIDPVFESDVLFFSEGNCVYALSTVTGETLSRWEGEKISPVTIKNGTIFWGAGPKLFAAD
jgi:outer membrane protein assembly factor BamB